MSIRMKIRSILLEISNSLPHEIQTARQVATDRKKIFDEAQAYADKVKADAVLEAKRLIEQDQIVIGAKERAAEVEAEADRKSEDTIEAADAQAQEIQRAAAQYSREVQDAANKYFITKLNELDKVLNDTKSYAEEVLSQTAEYRSKLRNKTSSGSGDSDSDQ